MNTVNCDMCGAEINHPATNNHKISTEYYNNSIDMHVDEQYDLCHKCFDKINEKILKGLYHAKT